METTADRLKKARLDAGYENARAAAEALGVNYTTYGQHENGTRSFPSGTAERYARKFKVSLEWLLTGRGSPLNGSLTMPQGKPGKLSLVPVLGFVNAGAWADIAEQRSSTMGEYVPSASDYPSEWQFAYIVDGPSLNRVASPGDRLICLDLIKSQVAIQDNDLVIVERSRYGGEMVQRSAKRVRQTIRGHELWPESDHPDHQQPIPFDGNEESDEVRVTAKVLWILKRP